MIGVAATIAAPTIVKTLLVDYLFEANALQALEKAKNQPANDTIKDAWLFMATALSRNIPPTKHSLSPKAKGILLSDASLQYGFAERWTTPKQLPIAKNAIKSVAYSPDGKQLASASDDQTIHLWDVASEPVKKPSDCRE